jgi:cell filamentation protein
VTSSRYELDEIPDPYSYRASVCLKNRLGLRDAAKLQAFEVEMSTLRALEPLPMGRFGPTHYCRVHRHLFQDVYRWAGRYRSISTSKWGNLFCRPQFINSQMKKLFTSLKSPPFLAGSTVDTFNSAAAEFLDSATDLSHFVFRVGGSRPGL